jgi:hypothetical protein
MYAVMDRLDDLPKPALIALVVIGFIVFWPVGVALLVYTIWSGRMFCSHRGHGRWHTPEDRDAMRAEWRARREEWREWKRRHKWGGSRTSSGNVAFDEYREETLRKLDEEQREFRDYLDKLRSAKDRAEFDQFMSERRNRPPSTEPPATPPASY